MTFLHCPAAIEVYLRFLEGRQSFRDLVVDEPQERLQLLPGVDDLDDHGKVLGKALDLESVEAAVRAETHHPAEDRGSRQPVLPRLQNQPLVEQLAAALIAFPDENAKETTVLRKHHDHLQTEKAVALPAQTAPSPIKRTLVTVGTPSPSGRHRAAQPALGWAAPLPAGGTRKKSGVRR